jgi:[acyl-carrier-protein] S-malonyltransferase
MSPVLESPQRIGRFFLDLPADAGLAVVFPGQGTQKAGMATGLPDASPGARQVFDLADQVLGISLTALCCDGPDDELTRTENAQPAILACSIACLAVALETGALAKRPAFVAGHSLGEYTALVASGALSLEPALVLVRERGLLMEQAGRERPGTMAALVGVDETTADEICRLSEAEPCNYNGPTQIVVGGTPEAVEKACALAKERGGRGLPLQVSGAFHTSLMASAAERFASVLEGTPLEDPVIPVIGNVTGRPLTTAAEVRDELSLQLTSPVLWHASVAGMNGGGVRTFVEIGPGRVLTGMIKRSLPDAATVALDGIEALNGARRV